jgi:formylglycine-generating enzyme required for sulfatase activity
MKIARFLVAIFAAAFLPLGAQGPTYTNSIGMEFVLIQPGTMQVGVYQPFCPDPANPPAGYAGPGARGRGSGGRAPVDPRSSWTDADYKKCQELARRDSSPGFPVTIAKPYYMGKFEVTQGQWKKVMGNNPSTFQGGKVKDDADKHPVETITWQQAQDFMKKLNQIEKTKLYRLPSEFEWEYAGRAGGPGQVAWPAIREMAVISNPARGGGDGPPPPPQTTEMVGTKKPNAWGLYDMLGNVWEWVADPYNEKMFADPVPAKTGKEHVLKGCGFGAADVGNCIYATHGAGPADVYDVGFRVLRDVK